MKVCSSKIMPWKCFQCYELWSHYVFGMHGNYNLNEYVMHRLLFYDEWKLQLCIRTSRQEYHFSFKKHTHKIHIAYINRATIQIRQRLLSSYFEFSFCVCVCVCNENCLRNVTIPLLSDQIENNTTLNARTMLVHVSTRYFDEINKRFRQLLLLLLLRK